MNAGLSLSATELYAVAREVGQTATALQLSAANAQILLSGREGEILGDLVRRDALPEEARTLFADRLAGRLPATAQDIEETYRRIRAPWIKGFLRGIGLQPVGQPHHVRRTRLVPFPALAEILGRPVYLKLESGQPVGSFKNRGATNFLINALLAGKDPHRIRIGAASHGNHAQGVVRAAHNLGIRDVEVLLPVNASPLKIAQLKRLGAKVELFSETFEEAEDEVRRRAAADPDYLFLPAFDHPLVVTGQGTIAPEISLQMAAQGHERFAVLAPAGGGGLLSGLGTYLGPRGIPVFGAESESHPYVSRSFHAKRLVSADEIRHVDTIADGIALLRIGEAGFAAILKHVADVVALPEVEIEAALLFLKEHGIAAEGAAAVPIAALLFGALNLQQQGVPKDLPLVSVVTGRNVDAGLLRQIEERGRIRSWVQIRSEFKTMTAALEKAGFLINGEINGEIRGEVRLLTDFGDAKAFLDLVISHLPQGWDPLDALARLHFGPWRPDGEKDINATLRSLGAYQERWEGNKALSLIHPLGNRGNTMVQGMGLVQMGRKTFEEADRKLDLADTYPRLLAETYLIDRYLERNDWLRRLWPDVSSEGLESRIDEPRRSNELIKAALGDYARHRSQEPDPERAGA